jgi:hypothetical protein
MLELLVCIWRYLCGIDWLGAKGGSQKTEQEWMDEQTGGW